MNTASPIILLIFGIALAKALPSNTNEQPGLIQQQAQEDYQHHQNVLQRGNYGSASTINTAYNPNEGFAVTFDNKDKNYRDRGYGYEKAYAYSRETAFFDFVDDKPVLDAKDIVEKYGNSDNKKEEDLLSDISH